MQYETEVPRSNRRYGQQIGFQPLEIRVQILYAYYGALLRNYSAKLNKI